MKPGTAMRSGRCSSAYQRLRSSSFSGFGSIHTASKPSASMSSSCEPAQPTTVAHAPLYHPDASPEGGSAMAIVTGWEGRFLEDFHPGDVYRCRYGRTVTEADNIQFTLLTCNTNQIHFNSDY